MKKFEVTVLGANAALPQVGRSTSAQVLNYNENLFLIDCGEGTQLRLDQCKIKRNRISHVFISHLHGDHVYGLPGLLTSYNHFSRSKKLTLVGVSGLQEFVQSVLKISSGYLDYELEIREVPNDTTTLVFESEHLQIFAFPLVHRVPTVGYLFKEKQSYNINPAAIERYSLSIEEMQNIRFGTSIIRDGIELPLEDLTLSIHEPRSYAYMSDTIYSEGYADFLYGLTTLYHESTYLEDLVDKAIERGHSTAKQAAKFAKLINAKRLLLGHFSSRYDKRQVFREEAKEFFEESIIVKDGKTYFI
ncbi:MAG TPA: ribonuclease Z [Saprospiraceae bacterium]|nr:ribonuclease Z [Saprospiraceae bacterium]